MQQIEQPLIPARGPKAPIVTDGNAGDGRSQKSIIGGMKSAAGGDENGHAVSNFMAKLSAIQQGAGIGGQAQGSQVLTVTG